MSQSSRDRKIAVEAQWVDWSHMKRANDPLFQKIISVCESKHIKTLMGFQKDWNKEAIVEFFATVYFGYMDDERAIFWMTEGSYYRAKFTQFIQVLGLDRDDEIGPRFIFSQFSQMKK